MSRNCKRQCAAASKYIFYASANEWLLLRIFQCFLKNGRLLLRDINERLLLKENVQLFLIIFFYIEDCMSASRNILMFFNERVAASGKILTTASEFY